jgi:hypothetical protein
MFGGIDSVPVVLTAFVANVDAPGRYVLALVNIAAKLKPSLAHKANIEDLFFILLHRQRFARRKTAAWHPRGAGTRALPEEFMLLINSNPAAASVLLRKHVPIRLALVDMLGSILSGQALHCLLPYQVRISFAGLGGFDNFERKGLGNRISTIVDEAQFAASRFKGFSDHRNGFHVKRAVFQQVNERHMPPSTPPSRHR